MSGRRGDKSGQWRRSRESPGCEFEKSAGVSLREIELRIHDRHGQRLALTLQPGMSVALMGVKGAGKSTASRNLQLALAEAGLHCESRHWWRSRQNFFRTPLAVLGNRANRQSVLILDRCVLDNVAAFLHRIENPRLRTGLLKTAVRLIKVFYPRLDAVIHLVADPALIAERRPNLKHADIQRGQLIYHALGEALGLQRLDTISIESLPRAA